MTHEPTRSYFERRLWTVFQVTPAPGALPIALTLRAVRSLPRQKPPPVARSPRQHDAFTLLFHGPTQPILEQCIYFLRPEQTSRHLAETACYLIPLDRASPALSSMRYSAVFDTPRYDA